MCRPGVKWRWWLGSLRRSARVSGRRSPLNCCPTWSGAGGRPRVRCPVHASPGEPRETQSHRRVVETASPRQPWRVRVLDVPIRRDACLRACPPSEARVPARAFVYAGGTPVTCFAAYLDEFGHIGPCIRRQDPGHNDSPVSGLASSCAPSRYAAPAPGSSNANASFSHSGSAGQSNIRPNGKRRGPACTRRRC